jgi:hypothetical protein
MAQHPGSIGMQALSTELDLKIIDYLSTHDKSCLARVSSYYRRVVEPLLYELIPLRNGEDSRIQQLLMTLLRLKRLLRFVKKLFLRAPDHEVQSLPPRLNDGISFTRSPISDTLNETYWSHAALIKDTMDSICTRYKPNPAFRAI